MEITILGEALTMLPEKALLWADKKILLLADLHLGKVNHFRKAGIPVPGKANTTNVELLVQLIQTHSPNRVIFLGDLFHSHYNEEWEVFRGLIKHFPTLLFELVIGNHDILSAIQYERSNVGIHRETLVLEPFILSHHPLEVIHDPLYNLAGHIHPGVQLVGRGKQAVTLPCFYFGESQGILPAFGAFTGVAKIKPKKNDQVYVIVENSILKCNNAVS